MLRMRIIYSFFFILCSLSSVAQDVELKDILLKNRFELGENNLVQVEILNNGDKEINTVYINYQINDENIIKKEISGLKISPAASEILKVDNLNFLESGEYTLKINIQLEEGSEEVNIENNFQSQEFEVFKKFFSKNILVEHFTNASCYSCSYGNEVLFSILKEEAVASISSHIAYHTSWPGYDPFYLFNVENEQANARVDFYELFVVPQVIIDGNCYQNNPVNLMENHILNLASTISPVYMNTKSELVNDSLYIRIDLESDRTYEDTLLLYASVNQFKEYPEPPGYNGESSFPNVMRYLIPSIGGDTIKDLTKGINKHFQYKIKLSGQVNSDSSSVLVFLQNGKTKEILQAQNTDITAQERINIRTYPENNSNTIRVKDSLIFVFNQKPYAISGEEINDFSALIRLKNADGIALSYSSQYIPDQLRLCVFPTEAFEYNADYRISMSEIMGENELILTDFSSEFKTRAINNTAIIESVSLDNKDYSSFDPSVFSYDIALSDTSTQIPVLKAMAINSYSNIEISQATEIPGFTILKVISEDEMEEKEYRFNFYPSSLSNEARLTNIEINGESLDGFSPDVYAYQIELSSNEIPIITAERMDLNADIEISQAISIPGNASISILAENGVSQSLYALNFTYANGIDDFAKRIEIYPNPAENRVYIGFGGIEEKPKKVVLYNYLGEKVMVRAIGKAEIDLNLNVEDLNTGIYLISLQFETKRISNKIMIK